MALAHCSLPVNIHIHVGLGSTVAYIEEIVKKYPCITFADATTFVGAVLTEAAGGPAVAWMPGRSDADKTPENPLIAARLPDGTFTSSGVVYYYTQLGLTDRELAVLNGGGHSIGGAGASSSGWNGTFTPYGGASFPTPKNLYFVQTFEDEWIPQVTKKSDGKLRLQYVLVDSDNEPMLSNRGTYVIRIPSDVAILLDGREPTAWYVMKLELERRQAVARPHSFVCASRWFVWQGLLVLQR